MESAIPSADAHAASRSSFWDQDYFGDLVQMMAEFPNLYADTSALNTPVRSAALARILDCNLQERFLHGSDFPVPVGAWYVRLRGLIDRESRSRAARISNLVERDFMLKQAMGFDERHFTRLSQVLRRV